MRILLVEDETRLAEIIARVLRQERITVEVAHDGPTGLELALAGGFDVVVLDRMLPGIDGMQVLRVLRAEGSDTPVLMLTALGDLPERVEGLEAGADDYLGKPFAFEELLARLRALARRSDRPVRAAQIAIGDLVIRYDASSASVREMPVELAPKEYAILELLARHKGQVLSRDQLLERVWGYDAEPLGNVVELNIHHLRRKLTAASAGVRIRTVRGAGYVID